jgi:hypothetical protein
VRSIDTGQAHATQPHHPTIDKQIIEFLSDQVLPAMLRAGGPTQRGGAVRLVLRACVRLMAEARRLADPVLITSCSRESPVAAAQLQAALGEIRFPSSQDAPDSDLPWEALIACLPLLGEVDWAGVDARLPGAFYTAVMDDRGASGSYYTPGHLAGEVARQTILPLLERTQEDNTAWRAVEVGDDRRRLKPCGYEVKSPLKWAKKDSSIEGYLSDIRLSGYSGKHQHLAPAAQTGEFESIHPLDEATHSGEPPIRILDPAVGGGHFLVAAGEVLAEHFLAQGWADSPLDARRLALACFYGIERDPVAAEIAACALWLWAGLPGTTPAALAGRIVCGDTLLDDHLWDTLPVEFDAVIGNPPFASVFSPSENGYRERLKARYQTAQGSFDLAVPFVERALGLCRDGGRCGLVLPNKILAAAYAAPLRRWIGGQAVVEAILDYSGGNPFEANVYPVACIFRRAGPQPADTLNIFKGNGPEGQPTLLRRAGQADLLGAPGGVWSGALDPEWETLRRCLEGTIPLGEIADVCSGLTVGEAYKLRAFVREAPVDAASVPDQPDFFRLATTGLIRRHHTTWGEQTARFLKADYQRPALPAACLPDRRFEQAASPKVIVAGLGRGPRAFVDAGRYQASVATVVVLGTGWPLHALGAILNAGLMARLYRALFGGLALSGGYLRFGKRELSALPLPDVPPDDPRLLALDRLARQRAEVDGRGVALDREIDRLVEELYGVE